MVILNLYFLPQSSVANESREASEGHYRISEAVCTDGYDRKILLLLPLFFHIYIHKEALEFASFVYFVLLT